MATRQLGALGLSASATRDRVAAGRLHRIHRGVFAVGHSVLNGDARWMAAVLAYGPGAVLSHRSAAALWGLRPTDQMDIDVTLVRDQGRSRRGVIAHRARRLDPADVTSERGIPCTTVPRTLLDLADVLDRRRLERAIAQAEVLGIFDLRAIEDVIARSPGRRLRKLRAVIDQYEEGTALTESELEERFLALCLEAGLPRPRVNAWISLEGGSVKADFLWQEERLIAETDGRRAHGTRHAFEHDRQRDQRLVLAGYRVVRFTWKQITRQPRLVVDTVSTLLTQFATKSSKS